MKNIMHVVSSHKGGVGKSITCLSLANHYIHDTDNHVVLVDTNPMNSNIADDLFYYFHREHIESCYIGNNSVKKLYTVSRDSDKTFCVIDATGTDIKEVISSIEQYEPMKGNEDKTHVFIIDTNAHIKNLVGLTSPADPDNWRQYFWFIWGWSLPRLHHHVNEIFESVSYLEDHYPTRQVNHIFNMYDFFDAGFSFTRKSSVIMKPLMKCLKTIDKRFKQARSGNMSVSYANATIMKGWIRDARRLLLQYRIPQDLAIDKLPELWAETITTQFETHPNKIPYNVLLIPTFYEELVMAMDKLIMGEHNSWKEIYRALKPMMLFIHHWLDNLEQFGT